jgi:hypothetical protein
MTELLLDIIIAFILGSLLFLTIDFLVFKFYFSNKEIKDIYTTDISTNEITYLNEYHEILENRLENDSAYDVTFYGTK